MGLFCQAPGYFLRKTYEMCSFTVMFLPNFNLDHVRLFDMDPLCFTPYRACYRTTGYLRISLRQIFCIIRKYSNLHLCDNNLVNSEKNIANNMFVHNTFVTAEQIIFDTIFSSYVILFSLICHSLACCMLFKHKLDIKATIYLKRVYNLYSIQHLLCLNLQIR